MKVYVVCESDRYELPVAIFETPQELARYFNCSVSQVARTAKANGYYIEVVHI